MWSLLIQPEDERLLAKDEYIYYPAIVCEKNNKHQISGGIADIVNASVSSNKALQDIIYTWHGTPLVSSRYFDWFMDNNLSGSHFKSIYIKAQKQKLEYYYMDIQSILIPNDLSSMLKVKEYCRYCNFFSFQRINNPPWESAINLENDSCLTRIWPFWGHKFMANDARKKIEKEKFTGLIFADCTDPDISAEGWPIYNAPSYIPDWVTLENRNNLWKLCERSWPNELDNLGLPNWVIPELG